MNGEGRIPPLLIAGLVFLVLAIGALAYYAGRFGRKDPVREETAIDLPPPGPPQPAAAEIVSAPPEVPPTVTPSVAVLIQRETRATRNSRPAAPLVERSSEVEVPVPPAVRAGGVGTVVPTPTPGRRIVVEIVTTPVPTPVLEEEPEEIEEEDPPFPVATPGPDPTPGLTRAGDRARSGPLGAGSRSLSAPGPRTRSRP